MPYKCVHCNRIYEDGAKEILTGCSNEGCQSRFFFYIRKDQLEKIEKQKIEEGWELNDDEKMQIEKDVREIAGLQDEELPIFLDFESVKIIKPGKYLLDLGKLFERDKPKVYKLEDGKYVVDLTSYGNIGKNDRV